jgi:hypothetical protein
MFGFAALCVVSFKLCLFATKLFDHFMSATAFGFRLLLNVPRFLLSLPYGLLGLSP